MGAATAVYAFGMLLYPALEGLRKEHRPRSSDPRGPHGGRGRCLTQLHVALGRFSAGVRSRPRPDPTLSCGWPRKGQPFKGCCLDVMVFPPARSCGVMRLSDLMKRQNGGCRGADPSILLERSPSRTSRRCWDYVQSFRRPYSHANTLFGDTLRPSLLAEAGRGSCSRGGHGTRPRGPIGITGASPRASSPPVRTATAAGRPT